MLSWGKQWCRPRVTNTCYSPRSTSSKMTISKNTKRLMYRSTSFMIIRMDLEEPSRVQLLKVNIVSRSQTTKLQKQHHWRKTKGQFLEYLSNLPKSTKIQMKPLHNSQSKSNDTRFLSNKIKFNKITCWQQGDHRDNGYLLTTKAVQKVIRIPIQKTFQTHSSNFQETFCHPKRATTMSSWVNWMI